MPFAIRQAVLGDASAIAAVQVASWQSTYIGIVPQPYLDALRAQAWAANWESWLVDASALIFVAEDDAGIFGFIAGGPAREEVAGFDAELYTIYLLGRRQRGGVGKRLVETLAAHLAAEGYKRIFAWVLEQNSAVSFYQRLGGIHIAQKSTEIGGVALAEIALGWNIPQA